MKPTRSPSKSPHGHLHNNNHSAHGHSNSAASRNGATASSGSLQRRPMTVAMLAAVGVFLTVIIIVGARITMTSSDEDGESSDRTALVRGERHPMLAANVNKVRRQAANDDRAHHQQFHHQQQEEERVIVASPPSPPHTAILSTTVAKDVLIPSTTAADIPTVTTEEVVGALDDDIAPEDPREQAKSLIAPPVVLGEAGGADDACAAATDPSTPVTVGVVGRHRNRQDTPLIIVQQHGQDDGCDHQYLHFSSAEATAFEMAFTALRKHKEVMYSYQMLVGEGGDRSGGGGGSTTRGNENIQSKDSTSKGNGGQVCDDDIDNTLRRYQQYHHQLLAGGNTADNNNNHNSSMPQTPSSYPPTSTTPIPLDYLLNHVVNVGSSAIELLDSLHYVVEPFLGKVIEEDVTPIVGGRDGRNSAAEGSSGSTARGLLQEITSSSLPASSSATETPIVGGSSSSVGGADGGLGASTGRGLLQQEITSSSSQLATSTFTTEFVGQTSSSAPETTTTTAPSATTATTTTRPPPIPAAARRPTMTTIVDQLLLASTMQIFRQPPPTAFPATSSQGKDWSIGIENILASKVTPRIPHEAFVESVKQQAVIRRTAHLPIVHHLRHTTNFNNITVNVTFFNKKNITAPVVIALEERATKPLPQTPTTVVDETATMWEVIRRVVRLGKAMASREFPSPTVAMGNAAAAVTRRTDEEYPTTTALQHQHQQQQQHATELLYWVMRGEDYALGRSRIIQSAFLVDVIREEVGDVVGAAFPRNHLGKLEMLRTPSHVRVVHSRDYDNMVDPPKMPEGFVITRKAILLRDQCFGVGKPPASPTPFPRGFDRGNGRTLLREMTINWWVFAMNRITVADRKGFKREPLPPSAATTNMVELLEKLKFTKFTAASTLLPSYASVHASTTPYSNYTVAVRRVDGVVPSLEFLDPAVSMVRQRVVWGLEGNYYPSVNITKYSELVEGSSFSSSSTASSKGLLITDADSLRWRKEHLVADLKRFEEVPTITHSPSSPMPSGRQLIVANSFNHAQKYNSTSSGSDYYYPYLNPASPLYRRILCVTYSYHKKIAWAATFHQTTARLCDKHLIFTDRPVPEDVYKHLDRGRFVIMALTPPGGEFYMNMWQKTRMIQEKIQFLVRGLEKFAEEEGVNDPLVFPPPTFVPATTTIPTTPPNMKSITPVVTTLMPKSTAPPPPPQTKASPPTATGTVSSSTAAPTSQSTTGTTTGRKMLGSAAGGNLANGADVDAKSAMMNNIVNVNSSSSSYEKRINDILSGYDYVFSAGDDVVLNMPKLRKYIAEVEELYSAPMTSLEYERGGACQSPAGTTTRTPYPTTTSSPQPRHHHPSSSPRHHRRPTTYHRSPTSPLFMGYNFRTYTAGAGYLMNKNGFLNYISGAGHSCHHNVVHSEEDRLMSECHQSIGAFQKHTSSYGIGEEALNIMAHDTLVSYVMDYDREMRTFTKRYRVKAWGKGANVLSRDNFMHHYAPPQEMRKWAWLNYGIQLPKLPILQEVGDKAAGPPSDAERNVKLPQYATTVKK